jgi:hypothetical protein
MRHRLALAVVQQFRTLAIATLVFANEHEPENENDEHFETVADQHRSLCVGGVERQQRSGWAILGGKERKGKHGTHDAETVSRGLFRFVQERATEVASAGSEPCERLIRFVRNWFAPAGKQPTHR